MIHRFPFLLGILTALFGIFLFVVHTISPDHTRPSVIKQALPAHALPNAPVPTPPSAMATLSFDDGYRSIYDYAIPILNAAGLKSTQYIITHTFADPKYMTKQQVQELYRGGHEIGAHSQTHPNLTSLSFEKAEQEIEGSKKELEALGIPVSTFAYPVGKYNQQIIQLVKGAGFIAARTTHAGYDTSETNPYELVRYQVQWNTTFPQVKHWIDGAVQQKTWLILLFHRIDEDDEPTSSRHELLQQIVDYLVQQKIPVITLQEGIKILQTNK